VAYAGPIEFGLKIKPEKVEILNADAALPSIQLFL
jgi:hypothetical protein